MSIPMTVTSYSWAVCQILTITTLIQRFLFSSFPKHVRTISLSFGFRYVSSDTHQTGLSGTVELPLDTPPFLFCSITVSTFFFDRSKPQFSVLFSVSDSSGCCRIRQWIWTECCQSRAMCRTRDRWLCKIYVSFSRGLKWHRAFAQVWALSVKDRPSGYYIGFVICGGVCALSLLQSLLIRWASHCGTIDFWRKDIAGGSHQVFPCNKFCALSLYYRSSCCYTLSHKPCMLPLIFWQCVLHPMSCLPRKPPGIERSNVTIRSWKSRAVTHPTIHTVRTSTCTTQQLTEYPVLLMNCDEVFSRWRRLGVT